MPDDIEDLGKRARVMLASCFMGPKATLFYGFVLSRPTKDASQAISELVAAGILHSQPQPGGGFKLSLTDHGKSLDRRPPGGNSEEMFGYIADNSFAISEPIPDRMTAPGAALNAAGVTAEQAKAAQDARVKKRGY